MNFKVEKDFIEDGFRCVVLGTHMGHRCGYVGIPKGHPLFDLTYNQISLECHGGLTYGRCSVGDYPVATDEQTYWIGFDCAHLGDGKDLDLVNELNEAEHARQIFSTSYDFDRPKSTEYVESQCKYIVSQIRALEFKPLEAEQRCRVCGCTDNQACMTDDGACYWVEPDLCSACVSKEPFEPRRSIK